MEGGYARLIDSMLRNRFMNFARIAATVILGFTFYHFIGSEMMPLADVGQANGFLEMQPGTSLDRKSTRLNSSHEWISYAVFCLKKKKKNIKKLTLKYSNIKIVIKT